MSCLIPLWNGESRWRYTAENRSSGAYGIPQALPGSKMSSAGADWRTNPVTQIRWGLGYIKCLRLAVQRAEPVELALPALVLSRRSAGVTGAQVAQTLRACGAAPTSPRGPRPW